MTELSTLKISNRGVEFAGVPDVGECRGLLETMSQYDAARNWVIGDIIYQLECQCGDDVSLQVAAECIKGISNQKQLKCVRVAQLFDVNSRLWDLSWSHYAEVVTARLTQEERELMLSSASAENWPVSVLRSNVQQLLKAKSAVDARAYFWDLYGAEEKWEKFVDKVMDKWPREHMGTLVERARQLVSRLTEDTNGTDEAGVSDLPDMHEATGDGDST